jgi:hypothetical protein
LTAYDWPLGATVTLTVDNPSTGSGVDYTDTGTIESVDSQNQCQFAWPSSDVENGATIVITDGVTAKTLVVNLNITNMSMVNDTISGTSYANTQVAVYAWNNNRYYSRYIQSNGSGQWSANFHIPGVPPSDTETVDLTANSGGWTSVTDTDGDSIWLWWNIPYPTTFLTVYLGNEEVFTTGWAAGASVQVTVDDRSNGIGVDYSSSQVSSGDSLYFFPPTGLLKSGTVVTASDGVTTRETTVVGVKATSFDLAANSISGTADANLTFNFESYSPSNIQRQFTSDSSGKWSLTFDTTELDLEPGAYGWITKWDDDGDSTVRYWHVPNPKMTASITMNSVYGYDWPLGHTVTLTIDDPSNGTGVDYTGTTTVVGNEDRTYAWFDSISFDILPGQLITLTDGSTTKELVVQSIAVTEINKDTDIVKGTAPASSNLLVYACESETSSCYGVNVDADIDGNWSVDFSTIFHPVDIVNSTYGYVSLFDTDGDETEVEWSLVNPTISAYLNWNRVHAYDWPYNDTITLTIDDPDNGTGVDYTDSLNTGSNTYVYFKLSNFQLKTGQLITLDDGVYTKTFTIPAFSLDSMNIDTDVISGTATAGSDVQGYAYTNGNEGNTSATADVSGNWSMDFSTLTNPIDITYNTFVEIWQYDENGNMVQTSNTVPRPRISAHLDWNAIDTYDWYDGHTVNMTIDDPSNGEA